ncbi:MFS general substrate transporter [Macroventuria anomochaeta]|uniref:MFS general substrate transporter n=1 Tax=Macroventuria anomochaeta TaxID=301207 RepID=A0ACB6RMF4_9PLEO|nr:MFS general substrate transporter [Macroventuria anomochaeta]KAF2622892.1 MFS general substrate transporter [Macroventuria anomochaeta]
MWSIVQYKQIGRDVERERSTFRGSQQSETTLQDSDPEQHASKQSDNKSEEKETEDGKIVVNLDGDDDPINPQNWPLLKRARTMAILTMLVFTQAWAGACDSLDNSKASKRYHVSPVAEDASTAMYLFGIGSGCLFVGPLSQTLGRNPVYLGFTLTYLFFILGTALSKDYASQIVCRYLAGLASSATLGINGASIGDMFRPVERALWFPVIAWVNVVPPVLAPIVGGWVAVHDDLNWQWVDWITLFISAFAFLIAFLFLPETYLPMLLDYKAKHLRRVSGSDRYVTEHEQGSGFFAQIKKVLPLSVKFATTEPAVLSLGGFLVLLYIILFTFLSGFDYTFKRRYDLNDFQEGACFAPIALGATAFSLTGPALYVWTRRSVGYSDRATVTPEFRLWPAMLTSPLLPISLFWLGWTNYSWISIYSGLSACFCFGIVLNAMYVSSYEYIIDSYRENASIALASVTMMRYLIAGGMVMAARPMYESIGVHWTMTLLGCAAVVLTPAPYVLYRFGKKLREKSPFVIEDVSWGSEDS